MPVGLDSLCLCLGPARREVREPEQSLPGDRPVAGLGRGRGGRRGHLEAGAEPAENRSRETTVTARRPPVL